jgi:protein-S-isoprenylcysteine O-methyltransferase Ste14
MMIAWAQFRQQQVAICPTEPTAKLITSGAYRFTRNPMYFGVMMMLGGLAFWFGTLPFVLAALAFFLVINLVFCPYEEQKLATNFGDDYRDYCQRVSRWL